MSKVIQIDISQVLRERLPRHARFVPRFVVRWLERLICQDEINSLLRKIDDRRDVEAARCVLDELGIKLDVHGIGNLPTEEHRCIFVSNHPLGGLDGLALIALIGQKYNGRIRFMVNDLLMAITPLQGIFLPVNKYGRQSRAAATEIEQQYGSDNQMLTFPAGLCSRRMPDGTIADLKWQKFFVTHAIEYQRDVVPIYFDARNSSSFYRIAHWRKRLGIKFNFERILLPRELFKKKEATISLHIGQPLPYSSLDGSRAVQQAAIVRQAVYQLASQHPQPSH